MKKYLITPVLVCLFFTIGCSNEDGSHDHDHDHGLLHSHNMVLEEEVRGDKTVKERFELVKVGMTFDDVKSIMGFPDHIHYSLDHLKRIDYSRQMWWYENTSFDPNLPEQTMFYNIGFTLNGINIVIGKRGSFSNWEQQWNVD